MEFEESSLNTPLLLDVTNAQEPGAMLEFIVQDSSNLPPPPVRTSSSRSSESLSKKITYRAKSLTNKPEGYTKLTRWDKFKIVSYNLIEPILVSIILGTTLQIS